MDLTEALTKLDAIPRRIDMAEVMLLNAEQMTESMAVRQYRFNMNRTLRNLAREISDDLNVTDLAYNMIMSRAGFEAVRILCELQLSERDGA